MPSPVKNLPLPVPGQQRAFASSTLPLPVPGGGMVTQNVVGPASFALPAPPQQVQLVQPQTQITLPVPQQQVQYVQQIPVQTTVVSPPSAISVQTAPKSPVVIEKAALFPDTPAEPQPSQAERLEERLRQEHDNRERMEESIMEYWTRYGAPGDWSQGPNLPKDFYTESYTAEVEAQREAALALGKTKDGKLFHAAQNRGGLAKWTEVSMTKTMSMEKSSALPRGYVPVAMQKAIAGNPEWKGAPTDKKKYSLQGLANAYRHQGVYFEVGALKSQAYESDGHFVDLHIGAPLPQWVTNGCVACVHNVLMASCPLCAEKDAATAAIGFMPSPPPKSGFLLPRQPGQEEIC